MEFDQFCQDLKLSKQCNRCRRCVLQKNCFEDGLTILSAPARQLRPSSPRASSTSQSNSSSSIFIMRCDESLNQLRLDLGVQNAQLVLEQLVKNMCIERSQWSPYPAQIMRSNKRDPVVTPASARYANLSQTTALFLLASSEFGTMCSISFITAT